MKSPAFQWYAADYLADERVMLLSLESEAAYVRLLSLCWREGSIPANPALCAPLCKYADIKVIKPALALFIKSPSQPGRLIHKRLEEERAKQEEYRAKQSAKGKAGGRPKKEEVNEKPEKATALPQLNHGLTEGDLNESSSISSSTSTSSKEDERTAGGQADSASLSKPAPGERKAGGPAGKPREYLADEAPIFQTAAFAGFVDRMGFAKIDKGHYLLRIQRKAEKLLARTNEGWENFILAWLDKDQRANTLQLVDQPAHIQPVDNSRFGPAERPLTTGYSIAARLQEQNANDYL